MENSQNLYLDIDENITQIKNTLGDSSDFLIREFEMKIKKGTLRLSVLFISGLVDENKLESLSLELNKFVSAKNTDDPTLIESIFNKDQALENLFNRMKSSLLCISKVLDSTEFEVLYSELLTGHTIILMDGYNKFISLSTYGPKGRAIGEPTSQTIIRGPKEAFTENLAVNISLIRRKVKDKSLKIENLAIGSITKTNVSIVYLNSIAKEDIVNEIRKRLNRIEIDGILDSGYIESMIKDDPHSVFPTILNCEKPDSIVANLLEGKVAIVVDGSPYVLAAPALFIDFLQVSEDYYQHYMVATVIRVFRATAFLLTLLVPATYIALSTFHQEMIPTALLVSIAAQREGVPLPAFVEAILMELIFEILKEASIRMPRAIGSAISIVGALVLGQAAVQAGIISAVIVIIVSITAISSFTIPYYTMSNAIRILRFILMMLSATFGLYGIFIGMIILTLHLCKLKSIDVPYMAPVGPKIPNENKDTLIKYPIWKLRYRPVETSKTSSPRIGNQQIVPAEDKGQQEFK